MLTSSAVAYRDDRHALSLQVADLERENEALREQVATLEEQARQAREADREQRRAGALKKCAVCGGSLLPVALFAGRDRNPIPLSLSTSRFTDPEGGFTRSAPVKSMVCSACGFIHSFMDISAPEAAHVANNLAAARPGEPGGEGLAPGDSALDAGDEEAPGSMRPDEPRDG